MHHTWQQSEELRETSSIDFIVIFSAMFKGRSCKLLDYTDLNWHGDKEDKNSTAGYIFMYGETPISWCSKKEPVMAHFSCETEHISASMYACQVVWLMNLMKELCGKDYEVATLMINNVSSTNLAKNPIAHGRNKHI